MEFRGRIGLTGGDYPGQCQRIEARIFSDTITLSIKKSDDRIGIVLSDEGGLESITMTINEGIEYD